MLIARAAGQPLDVVLTERVLGPLGMDDTAFFVPDAERHRAPSIERAAMNLFTAVGQRMRDGADGDETGDLPHRIAAILDEAAQKIERL